MRRAVLGLLLLAAPLRAADLSDRSIEILRYGCANELGHREVTLFKNGTVRLLDGPPGKEWMGLAELNPDEMSGAMNRLRADSLVESHHLPRGVTGPFIEQCELHLQLPDRPVETFHFGRYDTLTLSLSRVVKVATDMAAKVEELRGTEELPPDYEPRIDDVLKRRDGQRYRVLRFTSDKKGVEMQGIDQPIVLFVLKEQMRIEFVALLSRRR